jgi:hypothetical protein
MAGVYLAHTTKDLEEKRHSLFHSLQKAEFQVYPSNLSYSPDFFGHITEQIDTATCSLHIFGKEYGEPIDNSGVSVPEYQYNMAVEKLKRDKNFSILIWFPYAVGDIRDEKQFRFINSVRNSISHGITFANTHSSIQLVDDLRTSVEKETSETFDINDTEVFLIYNQLDDSVAAEVIDMLSDIVTVEKLNIIQDSEMDYSEFCAQQIGKSKLAVVYFKESADWALPFTQQIWKKIGGASSHTPILLIGDEDPESNMNKKFKAPKVVSLIVSGELVPLEIKVQYDKVALPVN